MTHHRSLGLLTAALLAAMATTVSAEPVFNRIASFPVALNTPETMDRDTVTSAEIIAATDDGMTLAYTSSPMKALGLIDISDPAKPQPAGSVMLDGEPTSVAILGNKALTAVNTSPSKKTPSGHLAIVDLTGKMVEKTCDLGGQPDSIGISPDKSVIAIAIENERDEDLDDGAMPQLPAGDLVIIPVRDGAADCGALKHVAMTGLAEIAPEDPEPEFISINAKNEIAVTLQENNHIVIVDGKTGAIKAHFPAGTVDIEGTDTERDGALTFDGSLKDVPREPDAVKWLDDDRLVIANEGDYKGGGRSLSIFDKTGKLLFDSANLLEREAARHGHYPDKRANKKGVEPEGLEAATFDGTRYFFVLLERASLAAVFRDAGGAPEFVQMLPSGIAPEGAVAIPARKLLVTANEADLVEDGAARSHVMVYALTDEKPAYPQILSGDKDGQPIGFGALSGLAAVEGKPGQLVAVSDSFYANQPSIFMIDASQQPARITDRIVVNRNGFPAQKLDLEGIAPDGKGGFWLASEGNSDKLYPHAIFHVNGKGAIKDEIALPEELLAGATRFGFEGIAVTGKGDDETLWMAVQREWKDDPKGFVKLVAYKPASKEWGAVRYPLDKGEKGWVGLSEITIHDGFAYVIERDNQIGDRAAIKKLYRVALSEMKPAALGGDLPVVTKSLVHDFLPDLKAANGYVVDKIEGFTFDASGTAYAVTDNDGVDDSSGETMFFKVDMTGTN